VGLEREYGRGETRDQEEAGGGAALGGGLGALLPGGHRGRRRGHGLERAGVSKRTLYNRFGGKDALVAEYLRRRDERWRAHLRDATEGLDDATDKLLAVFESYGEWLVGDDFRGCAFANAAAEIPDPDHPARIVARRHKEGVREYLAAAARDVGFDEPDALAERLLILLEGATATAAMRRNAEPLDVARSVALELMGTRSR
jgi:AcrR family transcriptional regulator